MGKADARNILISLFRLVGCLFLLRLFRVRALNQEHEQRCTNLPVDLDRVDIGRLAAAYQGHLLGPVRCMVILLLCLDDALSRYHFDRFSAGRRFCGVERDPSVILALVRAEIRYIGAQIAVVILNHLFPELFLFRSRGLIF